jgi:hypothetical protein
MNFPNQLAAIAVPIVTAYIVSASGSFQSAFVEAAVILLVGIAAYVFLLGRMEPIADEQVCSASEPNAPET